MAIELVPAINISYSALRAERMRMRVAANNLSNIHSTNDENGNLYQRRQVVFSSVLADRISDADSTYNLKGVKVDGIVLDNRPPVEHYAPYHPEADDNGMVKMPAISPIEEMLDMITATRAYEANLSVIKQSREMANKTINLGQ